MDRGGGVKSWRTREREWGSRGFLGGGLEVGGFKCFFLSYLKSKVGPEHLEGTHIGIHRGRGVEGDRSGPCMQPPPQGLIVRGWVGGSRVLGWGGGGVQPPPHPQ